MLFVVLRGTALNNNYRAVPCFRYFVHLSSSCSCLAHVVNLGNVDVMRNITNIAAVENATAIWEYDPTQAGNRVLGGSLDVIAALRTLAIKVSIFSTIFQTN
jgi:hypothetical protein